MILYNDRIQIYSNKILKFTSLRSSENKIECYCISDGIIFL